MSKIFLSYPSIADKYGDISEFRERLENELQMQTGDTGFQVFQDREHIKVGQQWESVLGAQLEAAFFLMPLVSSAFLKSRWCREEVLRFSKLCSERGWKDRIIPVVWAPTPGLGHTSGSTADEVLGIINQHQFADWNEVRAEDWNSPRKRRALMALAEQVALAMRRAEDPAAAPIPPIADGPGQVDDKRLPGDHQVALRDLQSLLLRMFSASEMRRLVSWMPNGDELRHSLPDRTVPPVELASELVDLLSRRDLIKQELFALLTQERPRRAREIEMVARAFGLR